MATEGQIAALSKWLKVAVSGELDFEIASSALARLHEASKKYNENKSKNKGIVTATKKEIIKELRNSGYLIEDEDQKRINEKTEAKTLNDTIKGQEEEPEEEPAGLPKHEKEIIEDIARKQEIIGEVAAKLSACTLAAKKSVEEDYNDLDLTDGEKCEARHAIAATILIQAKREGL